jgi:hemoglobin
MKRISRSIAAMVIAAPALGLGAILPANGPLALSPLPASAAQAKDALYKRLGGYDAIAAVSDDFIGRLLADPMFQRFFTGFSDDSKKRIRQSLVDFICEKTGGPCLYLGRDMNTTHAGLSISKAEWDRSIVLMGETLAALKVPAQESQDLASLIVPLEKDIVEKP